MTTDLGSHDTAVSAAPARVASRALSAFTAEAASDQHALARSMSRPTPRFRRQTRSHNDALCYLRRACTDRARQRLAQRLARQLADTWCIPWSDAALAPWLTQEHCRDNGEALVQWVWQELETCDSEPLAAVEDEGLFLRTLSESLGRVLAGIGEVQS